MLQTDDVLPLVLNGKVAKIRFNCFAASPKPAKARRTVSPSALQPNQAPILATTMQWPSFANRTLGVPDFQSSEV